MQKDKKGNPFSTLFELLEDLLTAHIDNSRLDKIIEQSAALLQGQADSKAAQETIVAQQAIIQADILSIKAFLGVPDVRIGATQEQVDALGARLQGDVKSAEQFDETIPK